MGGTDGISEETGKKGWFYPYFLFSVALATAVGQEQEENLNMQ